MGYRINYFYFSNSYLSICSSSCVTDTKCYRISIYIKYGTRRYLGRSLHKNTIARISICNLYRDNSFTFSGCNFQCSVFTLIQSPVYTIGIILTGIATTTYRNINIIIHFKRCILFLVTPIITISIIRDYSNYSHFIRLFCTTNRALMILVSMSCCRNYFSFCMTRVIFTCICLNARFCTSWCCCYHTVIVIMSCRGNFFLFYCCNTANCTYLTICKTCFCTCCILACNCFFCMSCCGLTCFSISITTS